MKFVNRAKMSIITAGDLSSVSLGNAPAGFQTFSVAGLFDQDEIFYLIEDGVEWELGKGRFGTGNILFRDEVLETSQQSTQRLSLRASGAFATVIPTAAYFNSVDNRLDSLDDAILNAENLRDEAAVSANTAIEQANIATQKAENTAADRIQTGLDVQSTAADRIQTGLDVTSANNSQSLADRFANEDEDVEISPGKFSGKHYFIKTSAAAAPVLSALGDIDTLLDEINGEVI
jgi:hypothetical protein